MINRLRSYQTPEGGFAYWPGGDYISSWVSIYVVQFLAAAQSQGYFVPVEMLQNAVNYLRRVANSWNMNDSWAQQEQAYRLYVLALVNKPDQAAMNRLKESELNGPPPNGCWLLPMN